MNITLRELGKRCKQYRTEHGYLQTHVAHDTGYSVENISSFETGRNDNSRILLWYFEHGMNAEYIFDGGDRYGANL